jgi:hypothetical protein
MNRIASLLFLSACAAACAAPTSDASEATSSAFTPWFSNPAFQPIVSCDGGAMTIEVNANERRELRVVVHDLAIARHVSQESYDSTYKGNHCGADATMAANPCVNQSGDLALPGATDAGVFSSAAFSWMRGSAQFFNGERIVEFTAWRDGSGIRLERMSDSKQHWDCDYSGSGWCNPPTSDPAPKEVYADWIFRSCTNL